MSLSQLNSGGKKSGIEYIYQLTGIWLACFDPENFERFDDRERGIFIALVIRKQEFVQRLIEACGTNSPGSGLPDKCPAPHGF
jgi:hypothetical protein